MPSPSSPSPSAGQPVRVRKEQRILGRPKFPGRCGRLQRLHPFTTQVGFEEQIWYVELAPTARASARVETFFGHQLELVSSGDTAPLEEKASL